MKKQTFAEKIFLGLTGEKESDWREKLKEINELKIDKVAVFFERFEKSEREGLPEALLASSVKEVPLVHLRQDAEREEIRFFIDNFKTKYFNIHEDHFEILNQWDGFQDKLFLEMNYDNRVAEDVMVEKIGGFCIDLSHFKTDVVRGTEEAYYVFMEKNKAKFACNHLNGFSNSLNRDVHYVTSLNYFDYLTTLPKYIFGDVIALEVDNNIREQIEFKKYLVPMLDKYFYGE